MFSTPLCNSTPNNLNYLLCPQLQNVIYYLSFWLLLFFLFGMFPPSSFLPSIPSSESIFFILLSLTCPPKALVLYLDSLRAFIASCLMLYLFMHVSWFSVKKCKPEIGKHVSVFWKHDSYFCMSSTIVVPTKDV